MKLNELFESKKALTFDQFSAAKKSGTVKDFPSIKDVYGPELKDDDKIMVYPGDTFIEVHGDDKYSLIIGNQEWTSSHLRELEEKLYWNWYAGEIEDLKDIPKGQKTQPKDWHGK
jgi:hypothetical protein